MNTLPTRYERQAVEYKKKTIAAACTGLGTTLCLVIMESLFQMPTWALIGTVAIMLFYFIKAILCFTVYRQALKLKNRYSTWPPIFTL